MIALCDVGPRDGLQNEERVLAPAVRAEFVERLFAAGLGRVEAVAFVDPRRVPAMAGAEEVVAAVTRRPGTVLAGLVLNERGYDRLAASAVDEVHLSFAVSESFNRANVNATPAASMAVAARVVERAHADARTASITISTAFGCPFEGAIEPAAVLAAAEQAVGAGADEVVFADTIGVGVPRQVRALVEGGRALGARVGVHLHNTRNTGYANAWAALEAGAELLDASVGGLGGCPFAPRATGNIATEDLVYLLHGDGVATGVDLDALVGVAAWLEEVIGRALPGLLHRAGVFAPVAGAVSSPAR